MAGRKRDDQIQLPERGEDSRAAVDGADGPQDASGEHKDHLPQGASAAVPDPEEATSAQDFIRVLRALKAWSGDPSLRELQRRTSLPRSTLAGDLSRHRDRLPPMDRVLALVTAFGASTEQLARWQWAWQRIQLRQNGLAESSDPVPPDASGQPAEHCVEHDVEHHVEEHVEHRVEEQAPREAAAARDRAWAGTRTGPGVAFVVDRRCPGRPAGDGRPGQRAA